MTSPGDRIGKAESAANLPQQYLDLKLEVEHLHRVVNRLQSLALLLAGGLTFGFFISLAISGWFAYNLEVQRRAADRADQSFETDRQEFVDRANALQIRINTLEQGVESDLAAFEAQRQRDRRLIIQLQGRLDALTDRDSSIPAAEAPVDPSEPR